MWLNSDLFINNLNERHSHLYKILRAGIGKTAPDAIVVRDSSYNFSVIHYILSGYGELTVENKIYKIEPGTLFVIPPNVAHTYTSDAHDPFYPHWIEFTGGESRMVFSRLVEKYGYVFHLADSGEIDRRILEIVALLRGTYDKYAVSNKANEIVSLLVKALNQSPGSNMEDVLAYIDEHYFEAISTEELSRRTHYSYSHFIKQFKEAVGETPNKYMERIRLNKAKELLCTTDYTIETISNAVGFCDSGYFIKRFKGATGLTPMLYRKENK